LGAVTLTTGLAGWSMVGMVSNPEQFVKDVASKKYNTWAFRLMTITVGKLCGYEADTEMMLLTNALALAQKKVEGKLINQVNMGSGKKTDPAIKQKTKEAQDELREKVCPEIMKKLKRSKTNSSFIVAFFKMIAGFVPQLSLDDLNKYESWLIDSLTPAILDAALCQICCLNMQRKLDPKSEQKGALGMIQGSMCVPFAGLLTKFQNMKMQDAATEQRKQNSANRAAPAAPVKLVTGGAEAEEKPMEDLKDRKQSEFGESTNSMVMVVMLGVCLLLIGGMYFILKGLGNPGDSEYPEKLGASNGIANDLNQAEKMV